MPCTRGLVTLGGALVVHGGYFMGLHVEAVGEFGFEMEGSGDGDGHMEGSGDCRKRRSPITDEELREHFSSVSNSHGDEAIALQGCRSRQSARRLRALPR